MSDFNPKQGEMILAKKHSSDNWDWEAVEFGVKIDGVYHCRVGKEWSLSPFNYAKPLPSKSEPIPFTHETWPKQVVWLRFAGNGGLSHGVQVIDFFAEGVCMKNTYPTFQDLTNSDWQMSLDFCQTWQPCHYNPNPTE